MTETKAMATAELVDRFRSPEPYLFRVDRVGFVETHVSWLFFAGKRVYKVKKPVNLGFVDLTTLERREHFCREEVRLNRRLAPEVYLGVVPITRENDGSLRLAGKGPVVEYAVEMVRLPAARLMSRLLEHGEIDNERMNHLARVLVDFHRDVDRGPFADECATPEQLRWNAEENFRQIRPFAGDMSASADDVVTISPHLLSHLRKGSIEFLEKNDALLRKRIRDGRIVEGHGDLHAENICFLRDRIVIYDCVEFTTRFRCGDVAADLAFLCMDLDLREYRGFSRYLARRYTELSRSGEMMRLLDYYKSYYAIVRGKVQSLLADDPGASPEVRALALQSARRYFQLSASYRMAPGLILLCGLPGSGKSTLSRSLSSPFEAVILKTDVERKKIARKRGESTEPDGFGTGLYRPEMVSLTYEAVLAEARRLLAAGRTVVVDATLSRRAVRDRFRHLGAAAGAPTAIVHVTCPEDEVRRRLEVRKRRAIDPSDADWSVYVEARKGFERPSGEGGVPVLEVVSGAEPDEVQSGRLVDLLIGQGSAAD